MFYLTYINHFTLKMIFILPSILPSIFFLLLAERNRRRNNNAHFKNQIIAATASAILPAVSVLELVLGLGGDGQAGLVFLFMPFYASISGVASYLIGRAIIKRNTAPQVNSPRSYLFFVPGSLTVFYVIAAIVLINAEVYLDIAENSASHTELTYLYKRAQKDGDDGILLFLSQNPNTSGDILKGMSSISSSHVRMFVAKHRRTPTSVLVALLEDEDQRVRQCAREEISRRNQSVVGQPDIR